MAAVEYSSNSDKGIVVYGCSGDTRHSAELTTASGDTTPRRTG
jgi:hypothetical protein